MKIFHTALLALTLAVSTGNIRAQKEAPAPLDLSGDMTPAPTPTTTTPDWYVDMTYAGFDFQLPAGTIIDNEGKLLARYPDGTFGLSMSNTEKKGANQDLAYQLCRQLARSLHLPDPKVEKVKFGKCAGAQARGRLEGQDITVLVLPYEGQEVTTVLLATPNRDEWVEHFLKTLTR